MNNLFVYGTLKNRIINDFLPEIAPFLKRKSRGFVKGKLFNAGEFPAAQPTNLPAKKVYGDLVEIHPDKIKDVLQTLDEYEEIDISNPQNSLFKRDVVSVVTNQGDKVQAWIYWYNQDVQGLNEIKDGIYRKRKSVTY
jgi:gamma-glutamylcyclotransferase (GGCT)/AIG2-like uncharacterized protein YtfP